MSNHLMEDVRGMLEWSDEDRVGFIRSPHWVNYAHAKQVLGKLEDLLRFPKSHRMPNLLLVGDTNNGKTALVERFQKAHPSTNRPGDDGAIVPVLYVQAPPFPDEGRFYSAILDRLFAPYSATGRVERKQSQTLRLLSFVQLRMLIIDEIHNVLVGNPAKQRGFLNVIKYLGNELQIPIVAVGTKEAFQVIQSDPQLANRFETVPMPRWGFNQDYLRLLASFASFIPLKKPSQLSGKALSQLILSRSEGYIGEMVQLLVRAAVVAIESGEEQITEALLKDLDWPSPTDRKRRIEQLT